MSASQEPLDDRAAVLLELLDAAEGKLARIREAVSAPGYAGPASVLAGQLRFILDGPAALDGTAGVFADADDHWHELIAKD